MENQADLDFRVVFGQMPPEAPFYLEDWRKLMGGKTRNAVYLMEHRELLPAPIDLGQEGLVWLVRDVKEWWASRPHVARKTVISNPNASSIDDGLVQSGKARGRPRKPATDLNGRVFAQAAQRGAA